VPRRTIALLAVAWTGVVLVFWFGLFVGSMRPGLFRPEAADLYGYFLPKLAYAAEEIAHGRLPLWNPWEYAGLPFLGAAQTAVLYPPLALAFALFPPAIALHVFMVAHYLLLGAGAFAMLRALRLGVAGAIFGTLCFAFQPTLMSSHYNPIRIAAFAWVPWMVAALVWTVEERSLPAALGLGVAAALQILAGYPEYPVDTAMVLALLLPAAIARAGRGAVRGVGLVAAAAVAAALVSAPQVVAIAEMFATSLRAAQGVPFLAGQQFELGMYGRGLAAWVSSISTFGYLPPLGWILVFVGVVAPRRPYRWALVAAWILASVAYSEPLRALPPFRFFRSFLPWSTLLYVPLAALAGAGFDRVADAVAGRRPTGREVAVGLVGLAAALPFLSHRSLAWLAVTLALLLAGRTARGLAPRAAVGAALVATLATIWTWIPPTLPPGLWHRYALGEPPFPSLDEARALSVELRAACGADGGGRLLAPVETFRGLPVLGRLRAVQGYPEPLAPARTSRLLDAAGLAPETLLPLDAERFARADGVLRLLDVGCVVLPATYTEQIAKLGFVPGGRLADGRTAYVRPTAGLARLVPTARCEASADAGLAAILDPGVDLREEVVVESPGGAGECSAGGAGGDARVVPLVDEPGRLAFRVEAAADAHLLVAVTHAPGWRAVVDGRPATVVRADYAFMAVPVPAGRHEVELRYVPRGFAAAVALALVGAGLFVAGGVGCVAVRRRASTHTVAGGAAASSGA